MPTDNNPPTDDDTRERVKKAISDCDLEAAFELLDSTIAGDPKHPLLEEYAFLLWNCFDYETAIDRFDQLIHEPRTKSSTLQLIAKAYFSVGRFASAAEVMQAAVTRDSANRIDCLEQLASCLERNDQKEQAIEVARLALSEHPGSSRATRLLAHIEKRNGQFDSAVELIDSQLKNYPSDWDWGLRYELAASLDRIGEYDRAWQELLLAKQQLRAQTRPHLEESYRIRNRQGEFARRVTDVDLKEWQQTDPEPGADRRTAFLAGFPRSGTTLLEQILTAHPDCVGTDETGILNAQFFDPIVWQAETAFDALLEVRSLQPDQLQTGRETYWKFTEAYIGETINDRLLIEKDPLLTCDLILPLRLFPESSIIMPLRDPRDVAVSFFFTMVPINWNSAPATDIVETAKFYHDVMRHWLLLRKRLPWPSIETRYEDMVDDQVGETRKLTEFLGLSWDDSMLDVEKRSGKKAVSTPTYDDVTKPIYSRSVSRWKNYAKHLEPALEILDPYAAEFGYES